MKLIREEVEAVEVLTEESNGKKTFYIQGPFLQGDIKNRNGRIYESSILAKEVKRYNEAYISKNRAMGELGHPDGPTVNLERVSHVIKALTPEGSNFIGEARILETPYGKIVKSLIDEGASLGVSSRGMGTLANVGGANVVKDDFYLATAADIVADPSAPDAFVEGIMEGKEWVWNNGILKEQEVNELKLQAESKERMARAEKNALVFESFLKKL